MYGTFWRSLKNMSKAIIISGGTIEESFVLSVFKQELHPSDCIIGVDSGAKFLYDHQIMPTYLVGDFDSLSPDIITYYKTETNVVIREYNPVKDASDTEIAVRLAIRLGSEELILLGATGNRIDHMWANIQILTIAEHRGIPAYIMDARNRIRIISGETHIKKDGFGQFFSVFPFGGDVEQFTIEGARYPLHNHYLSPDDSLCVSNEILGDEVVITFTAGRVILMETRDEAHDL